MDEFNCDRSRLVSGGICPVYVVSAFLLRRGEWCVVICMPFYMGWEVVTGSTIDPCCFVGFNEAFYAHHSGRGKPDYCNAPSGVLDNPTWVQGNKGKV